MAIDTIPGVDLDAAVGLKPAPDTSASTELVKAVTDAVSASSSGPVTVSCRDRLSPALAGKARETAVQWLPQIIDNPNILASLGLPAVEEINAGAQQLFHQFLNGDRVKIPELTSDTKELDRAVRGFRSRYDKHKTQDNIESYEKFKGKVMDFINRNRDWLSELVRDAKGMERTIDGVLAKIVEKQNQLARNVEICNTLLKTNNEAILKLVFATACIEYLRDEAAAKLAAIQVVPGTPDETQNRNDQINLNNLIQQIDVRLSEFKQRLFVAVATSPQIMNIRTLNYGLGQRLAMIVNLTIPVFKLTVVQWAMAMEAKQGADMTQAAIDFNNETLQAWSTASADIVPAMAQVIQTPSTSPETILGIADSLIKQFDGFATAYAEGIRQRAAVDAAVEKASVAITASSDKQAAAIRELVIAKPVELPPPPELPDVVRDNAALVLSKPA